MIDKGFNMPYYHQNIVGNIMNFINIPCKFSNQGSCIEHLETVHF